MSLEQLQIGLLGTPIDTGNRGVLALGASLVNLCFRNNHKGRTYLLVGHPKPEIVPFRFGNKIIEVPLVNCRMSPKAKIREHLGWILLACIIYRLFPFRFIRKIISRHTPWIAALEEATIVGDIRGGDSFSDIYGIWRFLNGFLMAWSVLLVKGSMVQFPQTFGPYQSPLARILARFILRRSSVVIARDEKSQHVAQKLIGSRRQVWLSPDVAFALEAIRPERIEVNPPLDGSIQSEVIGMNVSGLMYNGGYTRDNMFSLKLNYKSMVPVLITALLENHPGELWLVPHTYGPSWSVESDPEACYKVRAVLPEALQTRVRIVTGEYDCYELKGLIGQFDFFIGSRMHACIAALSQGVPCVGIAYSRKFEGVFNSVGMGEWVIDGRRVGNTEAISRILELYMDRDKVRQELEMRAEEAKQRLLNVFARLFDQAVRA